MTTAYAPIQINHSPQTTYTGNTRLNWPGAQAVAGRRGVLPTFTDANSIFVSQATGSDNNPGTQALPKATLNGCFATLPATFYYVVILDSETYSEGLTTPSFQAQLPNFVGIYAADGQTPVFSLRRGAKPGTYGAGNAARIVTGTPNYYIQKNGGNDATGQRGNALYPFLTISGALADASRQAGDIFQVQDSGIYHEDLAAGTLLFTLRAAQGCAPTLLAKSLTTGNGQISWASNAAIGTVDGFIVDGSGSLNYSLGTSNASITAASIILLNCTFKNSVMITQTASCVFTNCFFSNVLGVTVSNVGIPADKLTLTNDFFNCFFSGAGQAYYLPLGLSVGEVSNCSFYGLNPTGGTLENILVLGNQLLYAGGFISLTLTATFSNNFVQNGSLALDYLGPVVAYETANVTWKILAQNNVILNGNFSVTNTEKTTSGQQIVSVTMENNIIYAYGFSAGVDLQASAAQDSGEGAYGTNINFYLTNVIACGAKNNFNMQIANNYTQYMRNCSSIAGTTTGLNIVGLTSNVDSPYFDIQGFLDAGSPTAWAISQTSNGAVVYLSEGNASVISTARGYENVTLVASDLGNYAGPQNANGGNTSIGFDCSLFDLLIPCVLNGLSFNAWSPTLAYGQILPQGNTEGGVQSSAGALLQIQNCTFSTSGTYAVKAGPGTVVTGCLFTDTSGNAVATNQTGVSASNNVMVGCAGAAILNYGQNSIWTHNTAYSCEYGEYDSPQVANVASTSNIFSGSGAYDYSGPAILSYSCVGTIDPATLGSVDVYSTQLDPLFQNANGGNVMLQSLAFGYFFNSPCLQDAADGQDMGAYITNYGIASTAWTNINFGATSPEIWYNPDVVGRKVKSVKLAEGVQENGVIYSVAATYKIEYEMSWKEGSNPMPQGQMEALKGMFESSTNQIQVNFGDERGWIPAFLTRQDGFEWSDMIGTYAALGPLPVKQIIIQEA